MTVKIMYDNNSVVNISEVFAQISTVEMNSYTPSISAFLVKLSSK